MQKPDAATLGKALAIIVLQFAAALVAIVGLALALYSMAEAMRETQLAAELRFLRWSIVTAAAVFVYRSLERFQTGPHGQTGD